MENIINVVIVVIRVDKLSLFVLNNLSEHTHTHFFYNIMTAKCLNLLQRTIESRPANKIFAFQEKRPKRTPAGPV